jgi:hypothetical protein
MPGHALSRRYPQRDRAPLIGVGLGPPGHDRCRVGSNGPQNDYCAPRRRQSFPRPAFALAMLTLLRLRFLSSGRSPDDDGPHVESGELGFSQTYKCTSRLPTAVPRQVSSRPASAAVADAFRFGRPPARAGSPSIAPPARPRDRTSPTGTGLGPPGHDRCRSAFYSIVARPLAPPCRASSSCSVPKSGAALSSSIPAGFSPAPPLSPSPAREQTTWSIIDPADLERPHRLQFPCSHRADPTGAPQ